MGQARDGHCYLQGSAAPQMKRALIPSELLIPLFEKTRVRVLSACSMPMADPSSLTRLISNCRIHQRP